MGNTREEGCVTTLMLHSSYVLNGDGEEDRTRLQKEVVAFDETDFDAETKSMHTFTIGVYSLKTVMDAFNDASDGGERQYHEVKNNCSVLLIDMGKRLGINYHERPDIMVFIQHQLSEEKQMNL